jgi:hypothetical protein
MMPDAAVLKMKICFETHLYNSAALKVQKLKGNAEVKEQMLENSSRFCHFQWLFFFLTNSNVYKL